MSCVMAHLHGPTSSRRHFFLLATTLMTAAYCATGVSAGGLTNGVSRPVRFISYASGLVDAANVTLWKSTAFECGLECRDSKICSAFSVSNQQAIGPSGSMGFQCLFTFGEFTWTPNHNFSLFMEDIGPPGGYILATDGKFYKYYSDALLARNAREACMLEGGNLAVPHPRAIRLIITSTIPAPGGDYFVGMTQGINNITNSSWQTDDGASFNSSNKLDPNQAWRSNEPSNSGVQAVMDSNGTWNDIAPDALMSRMCRKFNYYTRSPVTGRYHKVHYELLDAAGAAAACASEGATLANVYGTGVYNSLTKYRRQTRTITGTFGTTILTVFLVGGTDSAAEGIWILPDGSVMDASQAATDPFQKWSSSYNNSPAENCLAIADYGFDDVSCNWKFRFLCEIIV